MKKEYFTKFFLFVVVWLLQLNVSSIVNYRKIIAKKDKIYGTKSIENPYNTKRSSKGLLFKFF